MKRLIIFLVRRRLKLKKFQCFRFTNQASKTNKYYFTDKYLYKIENGHRSLSNVSLNWILSSECEIERLA